MAVDGDLECENSTSPPKQDKHSPSEVIRSVQDERHESQAMVALTRTTTGPPRSVFTLNQKRFIVFMVSAASFFSPLSANIYFPALNSLAKAEHVSDSLINLTLTSYMVRL